MAEASVLSNMNIALQNSETVFRNLKSKIMAGIITFILCAFIVLAALINAIPVHNPLEITTFRPDIHYKRGTEGDAEYLCKICPADSAAAKDRLQILLDFVYWDENYFLRKADKCKKTLGCGVQVLRQ